MYRTRPPDYIEAYSRLLFFILKKKSPESRGEKLDLTSHGDFCAPLRRGGICWNGSILLLTPILPFYLLSCVRGRHCLLRRLFLA